MSLLSRLLIIGLDCAEPSIIFQHLDRLPHLASLCRTGAYGRLQSVVPPITCPAWMCMFTGKDPGQLGVYGFRNRSRYDYTSLELATSRSFRVPALWDWVGEAGGRSILIGVTPTYPPRPIVGELVSDFMTPGRHATYTFPAVLRDEVERVAPNYQFDVTDFRTEDKSWLLHAIHRMTRERYKLARHLMTTRDWNLFVVVEIGLDRLQHGFWRYHDPAHRLHQPWPGGGDPVLDYYRLLDEEVGALLDVAGTGTLVLVVSDHGARRMEGGVCINEWLVREGYLALEHRPSMVTPFSKVQVDWRRTVAWGIGGYCGRIFLNVAGREPQGTIARGDYERVREDLKQRLLAMRGPDGRPLGNLVYRPEELYAEVNNVAPDLIVLFGALGWRSLGSLGQPDLFAFENDTGPDDANHAQEGVWILSDAAAAAWPQAGTLPLTGVAGLARHCLGLSPDGQAARPERARAGG